MNINETYHLHLAPIIHHLAWDVKKAVVKREISVLARIDQTFNNYKYGAYAVSEAWSDMADIIAPYFNYQSYGLNGTEYVELIDVVMDELKKQNLIYLEW